MDISWEDARLFLAVAEAGSVSGAARALRLGQPTVTRRLGLLEHQLGAALFRRSVRGVSLTPAAERLLEPARRMADWAGEFQRAANAADRSPSGVVRVTASPFVCFDFVAPFAGFVRARHPKLSLEVLSGIQYLDLVRGEADVALRSRRPTGDDLVLVRSLRVENAVFVAKSLAARLPRRPTLAQLPWVAWNPQYAQVPPNPQLEAAIPGFAPAFTADSYLVLYAAAEAGLGAMVLPRHRHRFSRPTSLVPLDVDLGPHAASEVHLVCARSGLGVARVRCVVELLEAELSSSRSRAK